MDLFCGGKRTKRRPPLIEVYPDGFTPSHFRNREEARLKKKECPVSDVPKEDLVEQPADKPSEGEEERTSPGT